MASVTNPHAHVAAVAVLLAATVSGCGSSAPSPPAASPSAGAERLAARTVPNAKSTHAPVNLRLTRSLGPLPSPRTLAAATVLGSSIVVSGGLSAADTSTLTVFLVGANGAHRAPASLPSPVHDAAAATIGGHVLLFGGGQVEGTDRIVKVLPAPSRPIAVLPQPLSDLVAAPINGVAYVLGGWNGTTPNRDIYAVHADGRSKRVGVLPVGVRYPAAGALGGNVIVAGGETASTEPTAKVWAFDPSARTVRRLPDLPVATDHTSGAVLGGRFCVVGGLRAGAFTDRILCWTPGTSHWQSAGRLPRALADTAAVSFDGGIAVVGGRDSNGPVSTVTLLNGP